MASDRHSRQAGLFEHYRRTLPYSADIRDVPSHEFVGARFWSDNTAGLLTPAQQQASGTTVGGGTRGWSFGSPSPQLPVPAGHYLRVDVVVAKRFSPGSPTGFIYDISMQRDNLGSETSYLIRTGTLFPDPAAPARRVTVVEEAIYAFSKADFNFIRTQGDINFLLDAIGNFRAAGSPKFVAWTQFSVPADARHFPDGPGQPPVRPDQPVIYTAVATSGPFQYATNMVLSYNEATAERELAIVRGVV
jgi:hypothetical protein